MGATDPRPIADDVQRIAAQAADRMIANPPPQDLDRPTLADVAAAAIANFNRSRGALYADATFENYQTKHPGQAEIVAALVAYATDARAEIEAGNGVILYGPSGTGKDHLLTALAHRIIADLGISIRWFYGLDLFAQLRDRIADGTAEALLIRELTAPRVLYLSDPLPPIGPLTQYQATTLARILDRRNRDRKPTWCSLNALTAAEADERMGPAVVDRLKPGALAAYCNWPSFRRSTRHILPPLPKSSATPRRA